MVRSRIANTANDGSIVVYDYTPPDIPTKMPEVASAFIKGQSEEKSDFKISPLLAEYVGITRAEDHIMEREIEAKALEKLKEIQEKAYREAFELGLMEGSQIAYEKHHGRITEMLARVETFLKEVALLRKQIFQENEAQIVSMVFSFAKLLACKAIAEDPKVIVEILRGVVGEAHAEERVSIRVSATDFALLNEFRKNEERSEEWMDRIKFQEDAKMDPGGCFLETNYGSIDASFPVRLEKLWAMLDRRRPRIESQSDANVTATADANGDEKPE